MGHAETKLERIAEIELMLRTGWYSPSDLAERLDCDRSTIHRYLQEIEGRIELQRDSSKHYHIDPAQYMSSVRLTTAEALTIYNALRRFIRQTSKAPSFFISAIKKIAVALGHTDLTDQLAESSILMETERSAAQDHAVIWNSVISAWMEQRVVELTYQKNRSDSFDEHRFEPYLFEPAVLSHGVYVIGWSQTRGQIRTFKMDRILRVRPTVDHFVRRHQIKVDDLLRHAWSVWYGEELVRVELRFAPQVARRVMETLWHPSQQTELLEDGSLLWSVEIAGVLELIPWIRGWGHEVEVLAPQSLRVEIGKSLIAAAELYKE